MYLSGVPGACSPRTARLEGTHASHAHNCVRNPSAAYLLLQVLTHGNTMQVLTHGNTIQVLIHGNTKIKQKQTDMTGHRHREPDGELIETCFFFFFFFTFIPLYWVVLRKHQVGLVFFNDVEETSRRTCEHSSSSQPLNVTTGSFRQPYPCPYIQTLRVHGWFGQPRRITDFCSPAAAAVLCG